MFSPFARSRRRGITIAVVLVILLVLAVLGTAVSSLGILSLYQVKHTQTKTILLHMANGGLHELMDRINNDPGVTAPTLGTSVGTLATRLTEAEYWWTFETGSHPFCTDNLAGDTAMVGYGGITVPPHTALLIINADDRGATTPRGPTRIAALVTDRFPYVVLAEGGIEAEDLSGLDGLMGNARTNSSNIVLESSNGHLISSGDAGDIQVSGFPKGIVHANAPAFPIPDFELADVIEAQKAGADYVFSGSQSASTTGNGTLKIGAQTIPRPAPGTTTTVVVEGSLTFNGSPDLPQGIRLFVEGNFRANGTLSHLAGDNPDSFIVATGQIRFNGVSSSSHLHLFAGTSVVQNGGGNKPSEFLGLIYIEEGSGPSFISNGSADWNGSLIVRGNDASVDAANSDFTFDPSALRALDELGLSLSTVERLTILSWWVLE